MHTTQSFQIQTNLALSMYVHSHPINADVVGLYTPIRHEVTFLPPSIWHALERQDWRDIPTPIVDDLVTRHFLVPHGFDQQALAGFAVPPVDGFCSLYLLVSGSCNMRCSYCVVDHGEDKEVAMAAGSSTKADANSMSTTVADAAVRLFARMLAKHRPPAAKVTFYGGEPTLNREVLFHVVPLIRDINYQGQKSPVEMLCFTNGLTYDEALNRLFLKYDVGVGISIDGMDVHHDAARRSAGGKGSFQRVIESYHRYRRAGTRIGVSCTIGRHNYKSLSEIVAFFHEHLKIPSLQLQAPIQMVGNRNELYVEMATAARSALDAFKYLRQRGIEEGLALRRMVPFSQGRFHHRDCLAVGGELAVAPDGRLGPCHNAVSSRADFSCGNVLEVNGDFQGGALFDAWHARMPLNMTSCRQCSFIALCGGGCTYNAHLSKGTIWGTDPQQCGYMKEFVNWLLEDVWERYRSSTSPFR